MAGKLGFDQGNDLLVRDVLDVDRIVFYNGVLIGRLRMRQALLDIRRLRMVTLSKPHCSPRMLHEAHHGVQKA